MTSRLLCVTFIAWALAACSPFVYYSTEATTELRSAVAAANEARTDGPARVQIAGRTTLFVQTGLVYIPATPAERLLRAIGKRPTKELLGLLIRATPERTEMAALYSKSKPGDERPEFDTVNWREAEELAVFRPR